MKLNIVVVMRMKESRVASYIVVLESEQDVVLLMRRTTHTHTKSSWIIGTGRSMSHYTDDTVFFHAPPTRHNGDCNLSILVPIFMLYHFAKKITLHMF